MSISRRDQFAEALATVRSETQAAFDVLIPLGFRLVEPQGRYPRVSAEQVDDVQRWVHFWMSLDKDGNYRASWERTTPFELCARAAVDRIEAGLFVRYTIPPIQLPTRPYDDALATLEADVYHLGKEIGKVGRDAVVQHGTRTVIRRGPLR